jgi:DNA replication protein DnaC
MIKKILTELNMKGSLQIMEAIDRIEGKEEFAIALLQAERDYRNLRALERRINGAKFPTNKRWDEIDPKLNPKIDFKSVKKLGSGEFINNKENLCLMGPQGTGKSHSLLALGRQVCEEGFSVKFYTACALVNALEEAREQHKLSKFMQDIVKVPLLVIDELGFVPFSERGANLLFDVFASRYERGSIAVSTNLSFDKWIQIFGSIELTAALIDRFTHNAHIYVYEGESVRLRQAKKNKHKENEKQF